MSGHDGLVLPETAHTAVVFLDESGSIAHDQFFAVGCLKISEPSHLTRAIQSLRDRLHWYHEFHFAQLNRGSAGHYRDLIQLLVGLRADFSCFIADRNVDDPVIRFGSGWKAYESLATQLLLGSIQREELVTVLADNYSTPPYIAFEEDVKREVNRRLGRLAVTAVCRLDSKAADPLQVVDFLTSAVTFEFRQAAGLAGSGTPKADVARALRQALNVQSFLAGWRSPSSDQFRLNVALYSGAARRTIAKGFST